MPCEPTLPTLVPQILPLPNIIYFLDDYGIHDVDEAHLARVFGEQCSCTETSITKYRQCPSCGCVPAIPPDHQHQLSWSEALAAALYMEHLYLSTTSGTCGTVFDKLGLYGDQSTRLFLQVVTAGAQYAENAAREMRGYRKRSRWLSRYRALAGKVRNGIATTDYQAACLVTRAHNDDARYLRGMTALAVVHVGSVDDAYASHRTKSVKMACRGACLMESRYWPMFAGRVLG
jgi:hypothetical protein